MTSQIVKRKFEWIITNVTKEKLLEPDFRATSDTFHLILGGNNTEWYVYINTRDTNGVKYLSIWLTKKKVDKNNFEVKCCFVMGDLKETIEDTSVLFKINNGKGYHDIITIDKLLDESHKYVDKNGCLKISIEIELSIDILDSISSELSSGILDSTSSDSSYNMPTYSHYLTDPKFSDFTFQSSDNAELQVHRIFLAESSSFFKTLFTVDMQERESKKVVFSDINERTLKKVLEFVYSEDVNILDVNEAIDVLYAAEKFFMTDLKELCINKLMNEISIENVLEIFVTADLYKDEQLEKECLDFILSNYNELRSSREWSELKYPLLYKITDALATLQAENETQKFSLVTKL